MTKKMQRFLGFALFTLLMLGDGFPDLAQAEYFYSIVYDRMLYIYLLPMAFLLYAGQFPAYIGALKRSILVEKSGKKCGQDDVFIIRHFMTLLLVAAGLSMVGHVLTGLIKLDQASSVVYLYPGMINIVLLTLILEIIHYLCYKRLKNSMFFFQ